MKKTASQQNATSPTLSLFQWLKPQPKKFRLALSYTGKKELNWLLRLFKKYSVPFVWTERVLMMVFTLYCLITNNFLLWLVAAGVGALVAMRSEFNFVWWYAKVHLWKRNYYADRRELYHQGTLMYHFYNAQGSKIKTRHYFKKDNTTIWAHSSKDAAGKYKKVSPNREYIKI